MVVGPPHKILFQISTFGDECVNTSYRVRLCTYIIRHSEAQWSFLTGGRTLTWKMRLLDPHLPCTSVCHEKTPNVPLSPTFSLLSPNDVVAHFCCTKGSRCMNRKKMRGLEGIVQSVQPLCFPTCTTLWQDGETVRGEEESPTFLNKQWNWRGNNMRCVKMQYHPVYPYV